MKLKALFERAAKAFQERGISFAVAGGFAMDLYRQEPRLTMDVDFVILADGEEVAAATAVLESLGLHAGIVREADMAGGPVFAIKQKRSAPCMVVGRPESEATGEGVDVILPLLPWVGPAIERAQFNMVDFGFGDVPALTLEDAILSKLYALKRLRAKDLDDLQSIFEANEEIDVAYLAGQMARLAIEVPRQTEPFLPECLVKLARDSARAGRRRGK